MKGRTKNLFYWFISLIGTKKENTSPNGKLKNRTLLIFRTEDLKQTAA